MDLGVTGHCKWGRHEKCWHSTHPEGIVLTDTGLYRPEDLDPSEPVVYQCPCDCHETLRGLEAGDRAYDSWVDAQLEQQTESEEQR